MPSVPTTLIAHDQKSGQNAKGGWTLNIFKAQDGSEYKTFEGNIASQANVLLGKPVIVEYSEKAAKDPKYDPDRILESTTLAEGVVVPTAVPNAGPVAASAVDDRQTMINRNAGLARAIEIFAVESISPLQNFGDLLELAEQCVAFSIGGKDAVSVVQEVSV